MCKFMIHFKIALFCTGQIRSKLIFILFLDLQLFPNNLVKKKNHLYSSELLCTYVKNQLGIFVLVFFSLQCSVALIYVCTCSLITLFLDYCSSIVSHNLRFLSSQFFILKLVALLSVPLTFLVNYRICYLYLQKIFL